MPQYVVRPSVCLSVTFRYRDHIGWNSSKIFSPPNSLRPLLWLTPTWIIWCNGNTPKIGAEQGWGHSGAQKPTIISPKRCKIGPRLLLWTNRKLHSRFRLVPKSVTLNNFERHIQGLHTVFKYALISQERVKLRTSNLARNVQGAKPQKCKFWGQEQAMHYKPNLQNFQMAISVVKRLT